MSYKLGNYDDCVEFLYDLSSKYGPDEEDFQPYINIYDTQIESVKIRDDVKVKMDANKYNL